MPLVRLVLIAACDGADVDDDMYTGDDTVPMAEEQVTAYADWTADDDNFLDVFDADDNSRIDTTEWESTWLEGGR